MAQKAKAATPKRQMMKRLEPLRKKPEKIFAAISIASVMSFITDKSVGGSGGQVNSWLLEGDRTLSVSATGRSANRYTTSNIKVRRYLFSLLSPIISLGLRRACLSTRPT